MYLIKPLSYVNIFCPLGTSGMTFSPKSVCDTKAINNIQNDVNKEESLYHPVSSPSYKGIVESSSRGTSISRTDYIRQNHNQPSVVKQNTRGNIEIDDPVPSKSSIRNFERSNGLQNSSYLPSDTG